MSIYSIGNWSAVTTYSLNDIVLYNSRYYYSLVNNNLNQTPSTTSTYWGGVTTFNNTVRPNFIWKPNYNTSINITPRVKKISYGDGYTQYASDGVNNILLPLEVTFDLRSDKEAEAINHFLYARNGTESFVFTPNQPFNIRKTFICSEWTSTFVFFENHSIKCTFEEVPV